MYFSGHGICLQNGETCGLDLKGSNIHLEEFVKELALYKNNTVIGFFDCCRIFQVRKGEPLVPVELDGRYAMFFAVGKGKAAVAKIGEISEATK